MVDASVRVMQDTIHVLTLCGESVLLPCQVVVARWAVLAVRADRIRGEVRDRRCPLTSAGRKHPAKTAGSRRAEQMQESDLGTGGEQEWSCGESTGVSCARAEWTSAAERVSVVCCAGCTASCSAAPKTCKSWQRITAT